MNEAEFVLACLGLMIACLVLVLIAYGKKAKEHNEQ